MSRNLNAVDELDLASNKVWNNIDTIVKEVNKLRASDAVITPGNSPNEQFHFGTITWHRGRYI